MRQTIFTLALLLFALPALAGIKDVKPGDDIQLKPGEGLVLLIFDSNVPINSAGIIASGKQSGSYRIMAPPAGRSLRLIVASEGTYNWDQLDLYRIYFPLRKDTDFSFTVKAGVTNYPGDLVFRFSDYGDNIVHRSNRGLAAIDWLEAKYPAIAKKYPLEYAGQYPDPFPVFYTQERAGKTGPFESKTLPLEISADMPVAPELFWRRSRIESILLSPDAKYISEVLNVGETKKSLDIINQKTAEVTPYKTFYDLYDITWVADDAFVMTYAEEKHSYDVVFVRLVAGTNGKLRFESTSIPRSGNVLDPLLTNPDYFLFASWSETKEGSIFVHKVSKRDTSQLGVPGYYAARTRINMGLENDRGWLTNANGDIVAAVVTNEKKRSLMIKDGNKYRVVMQFPETGTMIPVAITEDGQKLYVVTDEGRTQRELVLMNITGVGESTTVFRKEGVDINSVLFDERRQPSGVNYYVDGQIKNEYFDEASSRINAQLSKTFPDSNVMVIDKDKTGSNSLIYVDSSTNSGIVYFFDIKNKHIEKIDDNAPWLSDMKFGKSTTVKVKTRDGLTIEAYLTMAQSASPLSPLVVMPHGGPIGIRDDRHFDRDVQFLASLGYSVLQVNFRGSDGFGKSFREAGKGSLGTAIEDDVDSVLTEVLKNYPIDKNQMCIFGMSYGGYSALVSSMRWPGRFKCAISFSGPSDRLLSFTASDSVRSDTARKWMEDYFGNPKLELEKMKSQQPLYSYQQLNTPLLLIHGTEDYRVDYEHVARLQRMLTLAGKPPTVLTMKNQGHGFDNLMSKKISWGAIAGFLQQYLPKPPKPAVETPAVAKPAQ